MQSIFCRDIWNLIVSYVDYIDFNYMKEVKGSKREHIYFTSFPLRSLADKQSYTSIKDGDEMLIDLTSNPNIPIDFLYRKFNPTHVDYVEGIYSNTSLTTELINKLINKSIFRSFKTYCTLLLVNNKAVSDEVLRSIDPFYIEKIHKSSHISPHILIEQVKQLERIGDAVKLEKSKINLTMYAKIDEAFIIKYKEYINWTYLYRNRYISRASTRRLYSVHKISLNTYSKKDAFGYDLLRYSLADLYLMNGIEYFKKYQHLISFTHNLPRWLIELCKEFIYWEVFSSYIKLEYIDHFKELIHKDLVEHPEITIEFVNKYLHKFEQLYRHQYAAYAISKNLLLELYDSNK